MTATLSERIRTSIAISVLWIAGGSVGQADSVVEYTLERERPEQRQALIKNGRLYVQAVNGSPGEDLLFDRERQTVWIIDHRARRYYRVDEAKLRHFAAQGRALLTAAESLAQQFNFQLPPEWRNTDPKTTVRYVDRGRAAVNGIPCRRFDLVEQGRRRGGLCIADGTGLDLPRDDYETLVALRRFVQRVNVEAADVIAKLGVKLPQLGEGEMPGIPVEIQTDALPDVSRVHLSKAAPSNVGAAAFGIPAGYAEAALPIQVIR